MLFGGILHQTYSSNKSITGIILIARYCSGHPLENQHSFDVWIRSNEFELFFTHLILFLKTLVIDIKTVVILFGFLSCPKTNCLFLRAFCLNHCFRKFGYPQLLAVKLQSDWNLFIFVWLESIFGFPETVGFLAYLEVLKKAS